MTEEQKEIPKEFDSFYKKYFLQAHDGIHPYWEQETATKIWDNIICNLQTGIDVGQELISAQSREIEELKQSVSASERFRAQDAMSAINEVNGLRQQITDLKAEIERMKIGGLIFCKECGKLKDEF